MSETLETLWTAVRTEFADRSGVDDTARVVVRLLLAALLGGLLGVDRERRGKAAGLRTHMLVAMGAALFVMVPGFGGMALADRSRVIQGVIAGIGFLGAGAIIKHRADEGVSGPTTAAGVWMTAAIGIACGLGHSMAALVSAVLAWVVLSRIGRAEEGYSGR